MWKVNKNGFLPETSPVSSTYISASSMPSDKKKYGTVYLNSVFFLLDQFMESIPDLLKERKFREEVVSFLRIKNASVTGFINSLEEGVEIELVERLFKHYCYLASSYVHALHENTANRLPAEIAVPLFKLSEFLKRKPILSYSCYALNNWEKIDPEKPIVVDNLKLQQNFSKDNKVDEDWFILIHVDIEARARAGIYAISRYQNAHYTKDENENIKNRDIDFYEACLKDMCQSLVEMNKTMARMPEKCSEDFYFKAVRPFIFSFEDIRYEGVDKTFTLRGETGAQSSIVPAYVAALDVQHKDTMLTKHLKDMRDYMPLEHREFLRDLEAIRSCSKKYNFREVSQENKNCKDLYNNCLKELYEFRKKHLEFAINYIQKKVDNPKGTGGTPFIPWLTKLKEETEDQYLK